MAVLDLASRPPGSLAKACEIALRQDIPLKFLELLLGTLREGGLVESRRGSCGGYRLAMSPEQISVGQVLVLLGDPVKRRRRRDAFTDMWQQIDAAASKIVVSTTFASLAAKEHRPFRDPARGLLQSEANLLDAALQI